LAQKEMLPVPFEWRDAEFSEFTLCETQNQAPRNAIIGLGVY